MTQQEKEQKQAIPEGVVLLVTQRYQEAIGSDEILTPFGAMQAALSAIPLGEMVEALEKLARLGNGNEYGNSDGNMIARAVLEKWKMLERGEG